MVVEWFLLPHLNLVVKPSSEAAAESTGTKDSLPNASEMA
jgi:hypothetical protein